MSWRARAQQVLAQLQQSEKQSIRAIARALGISKSSVHRHQQGIERRNRYPESLLWESPEGAQWMGRLVWGVLYLFGLQCGIGDETLSKFFHLVHLEEHVGVSPTALRRLRVRMEEQVLHYQQLRQQELEASKVKVDVCGGADETFFEQMVLVLMDLASGYIFVESQATRRNFDTWQEQVQPRMGAVAQVKYLVSDRAKALVKLALRGLGCPSVPDLFHALREVTRAASPLRLRLSRLQRQLATAQQTLERCQAQGVSSEAKHQKLQELQTRYSTLEATQTSYEQLIQQLSLTVHPFAIDGGGFQAATEMLEAVQARLQSLRALAGEADLPKLPAAVEQFSTHARDLAVLVHTWWSWVLESLAAQNLTPELSNWLLESLLPLVYWQQQLDKTSTPALKQAYRQAYEQAQAAYALHPLTLCLDESVRQRWSCWAEWMVSKFQRTSSAVEGRNSYLSRIHHGTRGLSEHRLQVLTVIHNFDLKRADGSTAAERLFQHSFPDLFEFLLDQMSELPLPRKSRKSTRPQMPTLQAVPA